jgi:TRAP-type uncharacterized transport system fused permease subunit
MKTGLAGVRFGWSAYIVPFLFVMSPALLMQGHWFQVTMAFMTATMGIYLVSAGIVGYMTRPVAPVLRLVFVVAGLLMMIPANGFPGAIWADIIGFVLGAAVVLAELSARRRGQTAPQKVV